MLIALLVAAALPSPADQARPMLAQARAAMDKGLNDYPGARLRDVHAVRVTLAREVHGAPKGSTVLALCGQVNPKTPAGGYAGWMTFSVMLTGATYQPFAVADVETGSGLADVVPVCPVGDARPAAIEVSPDDLTADVTFKPGA